jgi:hypothetical protein
VSSVWSNHKEGTIKLYYTTELRQISRGFPLQQQI